jgi:SAM-dependent methyltransferase
MVTRTIGPVDSVLDIGALDGASLVPFMRDGAEGFAVEPGWEQRTPVSPEVTAFNSVRDALDSGVQAACVLSTQTFEHLSRPLELLVEAKRLVAPGGHLVVEVPYDLLEMGQVLDGRPTHLGHPEHLNFYSALQLERFAGVAGLEVVKVVQGVQVHKYGGLIPSLTLIARAAAGRRPETPRHSVQPDAVRAEVEGARARIRTLQRVYQLRGFTQRLGRW